MIEALEKWLHKVEIETDKLSDCHTVKGSLKRPTLTVQSKTKHAYRVIAELCHGDLCSTDYVLHKCNNGLCINPDHLEIGTHAENNSDRKRWIN